MVHGKDLSLPTISINSSSGRKLRTVVQDRLKLYLGADYADVSLAEYVVVMLSHKTNQFAVEQALVEFLGEKDAADMTDWLFANIHALVRQPKQHHGREGRSRSRSPRKHHHTDNAAAAGPSSYRDEREDRQMPELKPWELPAEMDMELERVEVSKTYTAAKRALAPSEPEPHSAHHTSPGMTGPIDPAAISITVPGARAIQQSRGDESAPSYADVDITKLTVTVAGNSAVQQDPHQATARIVSEAATGAVLVKGIPPEATNADIRHHFSCCGHATRVSLLKMPRTGERSELAWVEFSTAVAAQKALDMSGSTFMSREVEVFQKDSQAARSEVEKLNRPAPNPQYAEYGRGRGRGRGPPRSFKWVRTES